MTTVIEEKTPYQRMVIRSDGGDKQRASRDKHVHACLSILRIENKYARIRRYFDYYPATANKVASELASDYNHLFWHFNGMVNGVIIQEFGYDEDKDYISPAMMLHYLKRMEREGLASHKMWSRGWHTRKLWSTWSDIPF